MLVQVGLCRTCSETTLLVFPRGGSFLCHMLVFCHTKKQGFSGLISEQLLYTNLCQILSNDLMSFSLFRILIIVTLSSVLLAAHNMMWMSVEGKMIMSLFEPRCKKTSLQGFQPGLTQTSLWRSRIGLGP